VQTTLDALVDPRRRDILDLLRRGERDVGQLVDELGANQPAVSKHLKTLREAGLVDVRAEAQRRVYRLCVDPLRELDGWLANYRRAWEQRLDALEHHLDAMEDE
jgi:DNA-binding transcriptional ArsR family regulator